MTDQEHFTAERSEPANYLEHLQRAALASESFSDDRAGLVAFTLIYGFPNDSPATLEMMIAGTLDALHASEVNPSPTRTQEVSP